MLPPETQGTRIPETPRALTAKSSTPGPSPHAHRKSNPAPSYTEGIPSRWGAHTRPRKAQKTSRLPSEPLAKRENYGAL